VIEGVSVAATPGEAASIVGPNGSGKTTLLKGIAGAVPVASGKLLAGGRLRLAGTPAELLASPDFAGSFLGGGTTRSGKILRTGES
jgi:ABC-type branched-subunit amino acid transport system ATPase component